MEDKKNNVVIEEKKENIFKRTATAVKNGWDKWGKKTALIVASVGAGVAGCHFAEKFVNKRKGESEIDPEIPVEPDIVEEPVEMGPIEE